MTVAADAEFCPHCGAKIGKHRHVPWWHLHRILYDWTLAWAYRPSATVALFLIAFTESIVFPVPPDVLLIPMVLGTPRRWFRHALLCTVASVGGAVVAYVIGWLAWVHIQSYVYAWFGWAGLNRANFDLATAWFDKWNFWIVFTAGFTPLPFKVFNIAAGVFGTGEKTANPAAFFAWFLIAALVSRAARFFLVAGLMRALGPRVTPFIDRYFNWLALLFTAMLIGGFLVITYMF